MKFRFDWKADLPYVLVLLFSLTFLLFFIPYQVQQAYHASAQSGLPMDLTWVYRTCRAADHCHFYHFALALCRKDCRST